MRHLMEYGLGPSPRKVSHRFNSHLSQLKNLNPSNNGGFNLKARTTPALEYGPTYRFRVIYFSSLSKICDIRI